MVTVGTITIRLVLTDDGDEVVNVETDGDIAFVVSLGMLRMAELQLIDSTDDE